MVFPIKKLSIIFIISRLWNTDIDISSFRMKISKLFFQLLGPPHAGGHIGIIVSNSSILASDCPKILYALQV